MTEKTDIDNLVQIINDLSAYSVLAKEDGFILIGCFLDMTLHIKGSRSILKPCGKNTLKKVLFCFPLVTDLKAAQSSQTIKDFIKYDIPLLHCNKRQLQSNKVTIKLYLDRYVADFQDDLL
jgi:hypothetical protein